MKKLILLSLLFVSVITFGQGTSLVPTFFRDGATQLTSAESRPSLYSSKGTSKVSSGSTSMIGQPIRSYDKIVWSKDEIKAIVSEEDEYDTANYFAVYLAIQTSSVTKAQTKLVKEMTILVKKNGGVMYTVIQSGVPPVLCGGPGQPKCQ